MKKYSYKPGEWAVICQVCGRRFPASKIVTRWDGLLVCKDDYETRHPQDLIRIPQEDTSVPYSNPESYTFIEVTYTDTLGCSPTGRLPWADMATANCATVEAT